MSTSEDPTMQMGAAMIDGEELIRRATALQPVLRARAAAAAQARCIPEETIADLHQAGLFRTLQPERYGGYQHDPRVFFKILTALGQGCPSTAWCMGVIGAHAWQLALFDPQAQEDVWGEDTAVLISSSYMPVGKVTPVEGGYRLSGRWGFSSGSAHCQWAFLGAFVPVKDGPPDMRTFLVPRSDYVLEDTWKVAGLKGTGSNDVVVADAFVPEHRTHRFADGFLCRNPGNALNPSPIYRLPFGQLFVRSVSSPALGIARGALSAFQKLMQERVSRADGARAITNPACQHAAAAAAALIDEAELVLDRNFGEMMAMVEAGEKIPINRRVQYRYESANAVNKCVQAVMGLFMNSGSSAIFLDHPMQPFFQDMMAARAHYANGLDKPGQNYGRVQFGEANQDFFI